MELIVQRVPRSQFNARQEVSAPGKLKIVTLNLLASLAEEACIQILNTATVCALIALLAMCVSVTPRLRHHLIRKNKMAIYVQQATIVPLVLTKSCLAQLEPSTNIWEKVSLQIAFLA
jgi:hypothetical protein